MADAQLRGPEEEGAAPDYAFASSCTLPTSHGEFEMRVYRHAHSRVEAIAVVSRVRHGRPGGAVDSAAAATYSRDLTKEASALLAMAERERAILLRVQDQCVTSEVFGSVKCDCKLQLDLSLATMHLAAVAEWRRRHSSPQPPRSVNVLHNNRGGTPSILSCEGSENDLAGDTASCGSTSSIPTGASSLGAEAELEAADFTTVSAGDARDSASGTSNLPPEASNLRSHGGSARGVAASPSPDAASCCSCSSPCTGPGSSDDVVGVVVYLMQEGRGIGLAAKVAAYALQEPPPAGSDCCVTGSENRPLNAQVPDPLASGAVPRGLDTVDANRALGLPDDVREYSAVPDVLRDLGLLQLRPGAARGVASPSLGGGESATSGSRSCTRGCLALLTNNPRKVELLRVLGVDVSLRLPCVLPPISPLAAGYMRTKAERMGHTIPPHIFFAGVESGVEVHHDSQRDGGRNGAIGSGP